MTAHCPDTPDLFDDDLLGAAERLADAADTPAGGWPEQMMELTDLVLDEIHRYDPRCDPPRARRLAYRLVARISAEYGGGHWYVPKPDALKRLLRDLWLWAEHDGTVSGPRGINALARRVGVSANCVWAAIRRQRARHRRWAQPDLLDDLDTARRQQP